MCGRYFLVSGKKVYLTFAQASELRKKGVKVEDIPPRYNASPYQKMPVVAVRDKELTFGEMKWGLVPVWSPDGKVKFSTFNARSEKVDTGLFGPYFKGARCLVPADGFYEWKKISVVKESTAGKEKQAIEKQPMMIQLKDEEPFMFAGLFSVWKDKEENIKVKLRLRLHFPPGWGKANAT